MKNFDPMNSGDDSEFERQLRGIEPRRPPAEWKALLLPNPAVPWFPKPLAISLGICWAAAAGLLLTTPEDEKLVPPLIMPFDPPRGDFFLLGQNFPDDFNP